MKAAFALIVSLPALLLLSACASQPPVQVPDIVGQAENACLPEAILLAENFHRQGTPAKILLISTPVYSHAAVVFLFPKEKPMVWVWDSNFQSMQVSAAYDDARAVAKAWLELTRQDSRVLTASFLE